MLNKQEQKEVTTHANTSQFTGTYCLSILNSSSWVIDSGGSDHMCHDLNEFKSCTLIKSNNHVVTLPDGSKVAIKYIGDIVLQIGLTLHNVLFVPQFKYMLLSVRKLISDMDCKIIFTSKECLIQETMMKRPWPLGKHKDGLYAIE